ncbi:MAG: iron ABC transporter permease [Coriobacteriia bacterium]|nr:iron ABC transporter permease [Coriobacteriia bacterium]
MAMPVAYVVWRSAFAGVDRWARLLDTRVPGLLWSTVSLAVGVTAIAVALGVALAWLVHRTDLPGQRIWRWTLALPLAIPPYVGAIAYIVVLGPRGWVRDWLGAPPPVSIYSFAGALFVLAVFTYPYVFLVTGAALSRMGRAHEEAARSLGLGPLGVLRRITLPMLRSAIGAGAVLVILYVLSDFGAVATLRYTTFTSAIYYQMGGFDTLSATVLSVVLIALTLLVLGAETFGRRRARFHPSGAPRPADLVELGGWRWTALGFVVAVLTISVLLPVGVLVYWSVIGVAEGALDARFWGYALNTAQVAGGAALVSMVAALPVVYLRSRHASLASAALERLAYAGYALPGVIVALGLIFFGIRYLPWLYNTAGMISLAYVVRFLPQAMQSTGSSLALVSPRIDEAARVSGLSPLAVIARVITPLVRPGLLAGGALVFVSSIKELPATLLLRPAGFDTLAVRVWVEASESVYYLAAPAALVIVAFSVLPLKWLLDRY